MITDLLKTACRLYKTKGGTTSSSFFHVGGVTLILFSGKGVCFAGSMTILSFPQHLSLKEKWPGAHLHFWWVPHTFVVMCCLLSLPGCSHQGVEMAENTTAYLFSELTDQDGTTRGKAGFCCSFRMC